MSFAQINQATIATARAMQISANSYVNLLSSQTQKASEVQNVAIDGKNISALAENINHRSFDFTNMSRRQFDELWKAGEIDMDLPPLILPEGGLDLTKDIKAQMDAVYDNKINFFEYYQNSIAFQKTLPSTDTNRRTMEYYQAGLNALINLQGKSIQPGIDIQA